MKQVTIIINANKLLNEQMQILKSDFINKHKCRQAQVLNLIDKVKYKTT